MPELCSGCTTGECLNKIAGPQGPIGPQGVEGPRGPKGEPGSQPPISDSIISPDSGVAASSKAVMLANNSAQAAQEAAASAVTEAGAARSVAALAKQEAERALQKADDGGFQTGMIIPWYGIASLIPTGWAICDGTRGTPDLRGRSILGASEEFPAMSTGGTKEHTHPLKLDGATLSSAQLPAHNHVEQVSTAGYAPVAAYYITSTTGGANQSFYTIFSGPSPTEWKGLTGPSYYRSLAPITTGNLGSGAAHTHGATSDPTSSLPPYMALYYIMKL